MLFIDEVHRFNKAQQDALLPAVENRWVSFIGATTENPFFSVVGPLLSRSLLLTLEPLSDDDMRAVIERAVTDERGLGGAVTLADGVADLLIRLAGGDARRALTYLEAAALGLPAGGLVDVAIVERAVDRAAVRYDRGGDQHYDVISAFIKSIRGSDADAALHYLARMIEAGEDPRFIARRLIVHASEDVGMADPSALQTAIAAAHAVEFVGLPEARINLAQVVIHLALAPKSNAVIKAINAAAADVPGRPDRPGARAPAGRQLPRRGAARARRAATGTRTTSPRASSRSSTRRTRSPAAGTTSRPGTAPRPGTPTGPRRSGPSWTTAAPRPARRRAATTRLPERANAGLPHQPGPPAGAGRRPRIRPCRHPAGGRVGQVDGRAGVARLAGSNCRRAAREQPDVNTGQLAELIAAGFFAVGVCVASTCCSGWPG